MSSLESGGGSLGHVYCLQSLSAGIFDAYTWKPSSNYIKNYTIRSHTELETFSYNNFLGLTLVRLFKTCLLDAYVQYLYIIQAMPEL
jgi:hypothetical protein